MVSRPTVENKTSHGDFRGWWSVSGNTDRRLFGVGAGEETQLFSLNKNATDMGTSVAGKSESEDLA